MGEYCGALQNGKIEPMESMDCIVFLQQFEGCSWCSHCARFVESHCFFKLLLSSARSRIRLHVHQDQAFACFYCRSGVQT